MMAKRAKNQPQNWPASSVEMRPLDKIFVYEKNPRVHPQSQIDLLAKAMRDDGVTMPILVDEDGIILAGHGRRLSALANGFTEYPVVTARGWSEEKKRAARVRDNSLSLLSTWDSDLIHGEIGNLKLAGYDIALLGFPEPQLRGWGISMGNDGEQDPEAVPETPKNPIVCSGDLWVCGDHRILCGDSRSGDDVKRLLNGTVPDLANCDPPYGINIVKGTRSSVGGAKPFGSSNYKLGRVHAPGPDGFSRGRGHGPSRRAIIAPGLYEAIIGDDTTETAIAAYQTLIGLKVPIICLWGGNYYANALPPSRCWLVWDKETSGTFADAELAWTNQDRVTKLLRHQWNGLMKASERGQRRVHPTQKPVRLAEWVIETIAPTAKTVIDLFVGSGSVLIACERKGLQFFGTELAPSYVQVAIERWQSFSGKLATLDGKTLDQVAKVRKSKGSDRPRAAASPRQPRQDAPKAKEGAMTAPSPK